ncbi:MAG: archease [Planctomycetes bacterium]|nr:archease [Planctomycetota bacterium]
MAYRFFDHTGDFGADFEGADQAAILREAVRAFAELLTGEQASVGSGRALAIELEASDPAALLVALGNELVYRFEAEAFLAADLDVQEVAPGFLRALLRGEPYDPARHPIARPVKAVTHHQAACAAAEHGWRGRLIFDL